MSEARRARPRAATIIVVLLAALLVAWLVVRNAALLLLSEQPAVAARLWPSSGNALGALAREQMIASGGTVDAPTRELAARALRIDPASSDPLLVLGFAASAGDDLERARKLVQLARNRQPADVVPRLWLLDRSVRTGAYAAALDEIAPAMKLRGAVGPQLIGLTVALMQEPSARSFLRAKLAQNPFWRPQFFQAAAAALPDLDPLIHLLGELPGQTTSESSKVEREAVLGALVTRKQYAKAAALSRTLSTSRLHPDAALIFDGKFFSSRGTAPFDWTLTREDIASANPVGAPAGGLSLFSASETPRVLAEQLIAPPPGELRLTATAARGAEGWGGQAFTATLVCVEGAAVLGKLALDPTGADVQKFQTGITVPPDCPAVRVQLAAQPIDGGKASQLQLGTIALDRR